MKASWSIGLLTAILYAACFPPIGIPEFAYVFLVPMLFQCSRRPSWKSFLLVQGLGFFLAWVFLISWLRHVTWGGMLLLAFVISLYPLAWAALVRWQLPALVYQSLSRRLLMLSGLAGAWCVLEWARGHILGGFPWLPLAASQWDRPTLLALLPWTGSAGASFVLIFFNLAMASWLVHLERLRRRNIAVQGLFGRINKELFIALGLVIAHLPLFTAAMPGDNHRARSFRVAVVQTDVPALEKRDSAVDRETIHVLEAITRQVGEDQPDFILWPESAMPWPVLGDDDLRAWLERLVREVNIPLWTGAIAHVGEDWYNGFFMVDPILGLQEGQYYKRKLVPFGEFIPLRGILPFVETIVALDGDFTAGEEAVVQQAVFDRQAFGVAGLICYEDIFPELARESVKAGADFLVVVTNNAWFGREGGAAQHASHSVLRAVENRRPVIRCGVAGWSGWIDGQGQVRQVALNEHGSIYFRGPFELQLERDLRWEGELTFYTRYGDWFILLALGLTLLGGLISIKMRSGQALPAVEKSEEKGEADLTE